MKDTGTCLYMVSFFFSFLYRGNIRVKEGFAARASDQNALPPKPHM